MKNFVCIKFRKSGYSITYADNKSGTRYTSLNAPVGCTVIKKAELQIPLN